MMKPLLNRIMLLFVLGVMALGSKGQSISADVSPRIICLGSAADFLITLTNANPADVKTYTIDMGNGFVATLNTGTPVVNTYSYQYPAAGAYQVTVTAKFNSRPDLVVSFFDTVYNLPNNKIVMTSLDSQCFKANAYIFSDQTTQAAQPSNPIASRTYVWGDGTIENLANGVNTISHPYPLGNRKFTVTQTTTDLLGCKSTVSKSLFIAQDLNPRFSVNGQPKCDTTPYIFVNQTPVSIANVGWFKWYFGDDSVYSSSVPPVPADIAMWNSFTYYYTKGGVFNPALVLKHKIFNCTDSFNYLTSGNQQPENIIIRFDVRSRRSLQNDSLADSVCAVNRNQSTVNLYNMYSLQGVLTQLQILWDFADPNANPPGSDKFLNVVSPKYQYKGLGMYFPTLSVYCPSKPPKTVHFYSRIDTLNDVVRYNSATFPPENPVTLNSINGYLFKGTDQISKYRIIYPAANGTIGTATGANGITGTFTAPGHGLVKNDQVRFKTLGTTTGLDTVTKYWITSVAGLTFQISLTKGGPAYPFSYVTGTLPTFVRLKQPTDSIVAYWKWFTDNQSDFSNRKTESDLYGYGLNILGPAAAIEAPPPPVFPKILHAYQKNQCGPDLPIEFVNNSSVYQSNHLYIKWDFADRFAPACTSFSVPDISKPNNGLPPYQDASDMYNRTEKRFIANGRVLPGDVQCKFSHDTLPIHSYTNWGKIYQWYRNGHDFPPYDTSRWTKYKPVPTGKNLVWPSDTLTPGSGWNKPWMSSGPTPYRIDTIAGIWPADMNPNRVITLRADIPDPIANARGYSNLVINAGVSIDTAGFMLNTPLGGGNLSPMPDGTPRRYKGNTIVPRKRNDDGSPYTLYQYFFERNEAACYTVTLTEYDSVNNQSNDPIKGDTTYYFQGDSVIIPEYHTGILMQSHVYKLPSGSNVYNIINNKLYLRGPDSIKVQTDVLNRKFVSFPREYLFIDFYDCGGDATVQLPLMKADGYGMGKSGLECPGLKSQNGGDPTFRFDNGGGTPGLAPTCSARTYILLNYDSLMDRHDFTPCDLDGFVDFTGTSPMTGNGTTPGKLNPPAFFTGPNWNPLLIWTSASGARNVTHYVPGNTPVAYTNMPYDKRGFATVGLIVGNGCASPSNCGAPECYTDTIWYHNFWQFITLDANFTYTRFDTAKYYPVAGPGGTVAYVSNGNYREPFCYLHGRQFMAGWAPDKTNTIFGDFNTTRQDYVKADAWDWGDGIVTVDSLYTNNADTVVNGKIYLKNVFPVARYRFQFDATDYPWKLIGAPQVLQVGVHVFDTSYYDTIWRCDDGLHRNTPQSVTLVNNRIDTAFLFNPVSHTYTKSSWEMTVPSGTVGVVTRRGDITPITHLMQTTTGCQNIAVRQIVIGVIDTFMITNDAGIYDTTFCVNETVHFTDSLRYWFANSSGAYNPFRPLLPGQTPYVNVDYHGMAMRGYPIDTIKVYANPTKYYVPMPGTGCPSFGWYANTSFNPMHCEKLDTFYYERIYWDFQSDGVIDNTGKNPVFKYNNPGRYKASMISRDSAGYWDTCFQFINVVKPIPKFTSKGIFSCADTVKFFDSTVINDWCFQNYGFSCDQVKQRRWWFGDFGFGPQDFRSVEVNPIVRYQKNGWFTVQLVVETQQGCQDTFRSPIYISGPRPRMKLLTDTLGCTPFTLKVLSYPNDSGNFSATGSTVFRSGRADNYQVISTKNPDTISIVYDKPGKYYFSSIGYDSKVPSQAGCPPVYVPDTARSFEKPIWLYVKDPYKVKIATSTPQVCVGDPFIVMNRSDLDTINKFRMYTYNNDYTQILDTLYKTNFKVDTNYKYYFTKSGVYHLVLHSVNFITTAAPCEFKDTTTVRALLAKADFKVDSLGLPKYHITNTSDTTADHYVWAILKEDGSYYNSDYPRNVSGGTNDPYFNLGDVDFKNDTGLFWICLWTYTPAPQNCKDSICKQVSNSFQVDINVPNVFTPNGDGVNDVFNIKIKGQETYDLKVYNRWGELVFESKDPAIQWNGKNKNTGGECEEGTYFFVFKYKLRNTAEKTLHGTVTLIR